MIVTELEKMSADGKGTRNLEDALYFWNVC